MPAGEGRSREHFGAVTKGDGLARFRPLADESRRAHLISVELQIIVIGMAVKF